jgi:hypothetical protein
MQVLNGSRSTTLKAMPSNMRSMIKASRPVAARGNPNHCFRLSIKFYRVG